MLRESIRANQIDLDLRSLTDPDVDPKATGAKQILAFVDAALVDATDLDARRAELADTIGERAAANVATVTGNFEMMNRILDAVGVPA